MGVPRLYSEEIGRSRPCWSRVSSCFLPDPSRSWFAIAFDCGPPSSCTMPSDRKSTRLNSSHLVISYAVFCLKKKKKKKNTIMHTCATHGLPDEACAQDA